MKLVGSDKYVIGFDVNNSYAQISYAKVGTDNVESLSSVAGAESYNIPAVLCKQAGGTQWFYGREAWKQARENDGILVEDLLQLALDGEPLQIEGETFLPGVLLGLFFKKCFGMLAQVTTPDKVTAVMITSEKMNDRVQAVLGEAAAEAGLKPDRVFFLSHGESFYHYMLRQPEELCRFQSLLCEYRGRELLISRMERNRRTTPVAVYLEEEKYPFVSYDPMPEGEALREEKLHRLDREFLEILGRVCENRMISSVYLVGEAFSQEWLKESLKYLCRGRRVFQGNNLYSKGACYGMLEQLSETREGRSHVFLGEEKLKVNVGMKLKRRGEAVYCPLLDAGVNWYEARASLQFYLQQGNTVELRFTSLTGEKNKLASIALEGLEEGSCRLELRLAMKDERHMVIEIEDLGFGAFRAATHRVWREELKL